MERQSDGTPKGVKRLMAKDLAKSKKEQQRALRESFMNLFEESLDTLGHHHRGMPLENKMSRYCETAWRTLAYWCRINGIEFASAKTYSPVETLKKAIIQATDK